MKKLDTERIPINWLDDIDYNTYIRQNLANLLAFKHVCLMPDAPQDMECLLGCISCRWSDCT